MDEANFGKWMELNSFRVQRLGLAYTKGRLSIGNVVGRAIFDCAIAVCDEEIAARAADVNERVVTVVERVGGATRPMPYAALTFGRQGIPAEEIGGGSLVVLDENAQFKFADNAGPNWALDCVGDGEGLIADTGECTVELVRQS